MVPELYTILAADPPLLQPHYDSLLVKCTTRGATFEIARRKMLRALVEFRIRGLSFLRCRRFPSLTPRRRCQDQHSILVPSALSRGLRLWWNLDYCEWFHPSRPLRIDLTEAVTSSSTILLLSSNSSLRKIELRRSSPTSEIWSSTVHPSKDKSEDQDFTRRFLFRLSSIPSTRPRSSTRAFPALPDGETSSRRRDQLDSPRPFESTPEC